MKKMSTGIRSSVDMQGRSSQTNGSTRIPRLSRTKKSIDRGGIENGKIPKQLQRSKSTLGVGSFTPIRSSRAASTGRISNKIGSAQKQPHVTYLENLFRNKTTVKDTRPLTDKQYLTSQLTKVQNFLQTLPGGSDILNSGTNLRPLTTNMFVQACNLLLKEIDPVYNITMANYVEELPAVMSKLRYPTTLSKSLMVSANIPRNWPNVLGILAWLVDIVNMSNESIDARIDERSETGFQYRMLELGVQSFKLWMNEDNYTPLIDEFFKIDLEGVGYEINESKKKIEELSEKRAELLEKSADKDNLKMKMNEQENSFATSNKRIKELQDLFQRSTQNIVNIKNDINTVRKTEDEYKKTIQNLRERVAKQPANSKERDVMKLECEDIERRISHKQDILDQLTNQNKELDEKIKEKKETLDDFVKKYNKDVLSYSTEHPEFAKFVLPCLTVEHDNVLKVIDDMISMMQDIKNSKTKLLASQTKKLVEVKDEIRKKDENLFQVGAQLNKLKMKYNSVVEEETKYNKFLESMNKDYEMKLEECEEKLRIAQNFINKDLTKLKNSVTETEEKAKEIKESVKVYASEIRQKLKVEYANVQSYVDQVKELTQKTMNEIIEGNKKIEKNF